VDPNFFPAAGTNDDLGDSLPKEVRLMPPWMEILINVIGYAGFIGIAKYHKPSDEIEPDL
jgi:hypothetical protein